MNTTHGYALVPIGEAVTQAWLDGFEVVTEHGTGEGESYAQTHWVIEDCGAQEPAIKADIEAKGGTVYATGEAVREAMNGLNE